MWNSLCNRQMQYSSTWRLENPNEETPCMWPKVQTCHHLLNPFPMTGHTWHCFFLLLKPRTYFHDRLINGAAKIFSNLLCHDRESNSHLFSCTSLRELNSERFTNWATVAASLDIVGIKKVPSKNKISYLWIIYSRFLFQVTFLSVSIFFHISRDLKNIFFSCSLRRRKRRHRSRHRRLSGQKRSWKVN